MKTTIFLTLFLIIVCCQEISARVKGCPSSSYFKGINCNKYASCTKRCHKGPFIKCCSAGKCGKRCVDIRTTTPPPTTTTTTTTTPIPTTTTTTTTTPKPTTTTPTTPKPTTTKPTDPPTTKPTDPPTPKPTDPPTPKPTDPPTPKPIDPPTAAPVAQPIIIYQQSQAVAAQGVAQVAVMAQCPNPKSVNVYCKRREDQCTSYSGCTPPNACCQISNCGTMCVRPSIGRSPNCPHPDFFNFVCTKTYDDCRMDVDCPLNHFCCRVSNCGNRCIAASTAKPEPKPCPASFNQFCVFFYQNNCKTHWDCPDDHNCCLVPTCGTRCLPT